eukprot:scaffold13314_cov31-Tisochrysis_lutea.AAC.2
MALALLSSSLESPFFSHPKRRAAREPSEHDDAARSAASRAESTGSAISRVLAVVASTRPQSSTASRTELKIVALCSTGVAPHARDMAVSLSGSQAGWTNRSSQRPKLSIARATDPTLPPIARWECGSVGLVYAVRGRD